MKRLILAIFRIFVMVCFSTAVAYAADSAKIVAQGNRFYRDRKYGEALKLYNQALAGDPGSAALNFNAGAAHFKSGDYRNAAGSFEKALATQDKALEAWANYNLANSKYKAGKLMQGSDLNSAVNLLGESLDHYKRAIDLNPQDEDAKFNYEFVDKELKSLKEKLKQQQQSKQDEREEPQQTLKQGQSGKNKGNKPETQKDEAQGSEQSKPQEGQGKQAEGQEAQKQERQAGKEQEEQNLKEMSPREAGMLLDDYRQEEKGRLNDTRQAQPQEVQKDW